MTAKRVVVLGLALATIVAGVVAVVIGGVPKHAPSTALSPGPGSDAASTPVAEGPGLTGRWFGDDGDPLPDGRGPGGRLVAGVFRGPGHCQWQSVEILVVSWPIGSTSTYTTSEDVRVYVRDTRGALRNYFGNRRLSRLFEPDAELPPEARPTGFRRGLWALSLSPSDADRFAYLVSPDRVERWVRPPRRLGCD